MRLNLFLEPYKEPCPDWLMSFKPGDQFDIKAFLNSRTIYCPHKFNDRHPVKLFSRTHSAHCFVYVDYFSAPQKFEDSLINSISEYHLRFKNYHTLERLHLSLSDLLPDDWTSNSGNYHTSTFDRELESFGLLELLERDAGLDDSYGAARIAILFINASIIATYDALYCQENGVNPPFAVLCHDTCFMNDEGKLGKGGHFERVAKSYHVFPQFLLMNDGAQPWDGYTEISHVNGTPADWHGTMRHLFQRNVPKNSL